ncbi:hypothetical protein E5S70_17560 [Ensifer adhaerens]|uniref:hypothetical protein n=1 Tax=Ensifer canadensis TaxID=555315 RepID=UPI001490081A|nr:hypothetical protein [Ensifer canadensis]NOV17861.1 hypothetical protein [Ensifer canadensis]
MFENPILNAIAMFSGFIWLLLLIFIGFKLGQREVVLYRRRRRAETETAPKGRYSDVQDSIRRAQV